MKNSMPEVVNNFATLGNTDLSNLLSTTSGIASNLKAIKETGNININLGFTIKPPEEYNQHIMLDFFPDHVVKYKKRMGGGKMQERKSPYVQERKSPYVQERKSPYVQERKSPYVKNYGIEEEETFSVPPKKQEENFFISSIGCNDIYSCW